MIAGPESFNKTRGVYSAGDCVLYWLGDGKFILDDVFVEKYGYMDDLSRLPLEYYVGELNLPECCTSCMNENTKYVYKECINSPENDLMTVCEKCHNGIITMRRHINGGQKWWVIDGVLYMTHDGRVENIQIYEIFFPFVSMQPLKNFILGCTVTSDGTYCCACGQQSPTILWRSSYDCIDVCDECKDCMDVCVNLMVVKLTMLREMMNGIPEDIRRVIIGIIIDAFSVRMIKGKIFRENENVNVPEELLI